MPRRRWRHKNSCWNGFRSGASAAPRPPFHGIKELHLIKEPVGQGRYRYAVSAHRTKLNFADRLRTIFREGVLSVDYAQNLVVIKTMPGLANGAAAALDGMEVPYLVGSLAGDDTVLLVLRDNAAAAEFADEIKEMLR